MSYSALDRYLESRVLSADPLELVRMLYQAAVRAVCDARRHLAAGEIRERAQAISRAVEILIELESSLDPQHGGAIATNLARLYDYMRRRLTEAHIRQADDPLREVLGLLTTLSEAWDGLKTEQPAADVPASGAWTQSQWEEPAAAGCGSHGWSL